MNMAHNYGVPVQFVLFDLGRVLLDWEPDRLYQKLIPDQQARARFLSTVCTMEWHGRHDAGAGFAENAQPLIEKFPKHTHLIRAWGERWFEMFDGYIAGVPSLIDRLEAAKVPLAEIYKIALARMGDPAPETVLFIDDSAPNIVAADALGFQTHLFTSAKGLETALIKRDLLG